MTPRRSRTKWCVQAAPVETRLMAVDDAIAAGAMALFGEKYGDEVRVVTMGTRQHGANAGRTYSMELCGGTHVRNTGEIGIIKLVGEGAVASGVRRIEALTGEAARRYLEEQEERVKAISAILKVPAGDAVSRVEALVEERRKLERELADARKKLAMGGGNGAGQAAEAVNGVNFIGQIVEGIAAKDLKGLVDEAKARIGSGVAAIVSVSPRRQGRDRGRRHQRPRRHDQRGRPGARRIAGRRRIGRWRKAGHGAGGRTGRREGAGCA